MDRQKDIGRYQRPHLRIASLGKNTETGLSDWLQHSINKDRTEMSVTKTSIQDLRPQLMPALSITSFSAPGQARRAYSPRVDKVNVGIILPETINFNQEKTAYDYDMP